MSSISFTDLHVHGTHPPHGGVHRTCRQADERKKPTQTRFTLPLLFTGLRRMAASSSTAATGPLNSPYTQALHALRTQPWIPCCAPYTEKWLRKSTPYGIVQ